MWRRLRLGGIRGELRFVLLFGNLGLEMWPELIADHMQAGLHLYALIDSCRYS